MIETLNGFHETVNFKDRPMFRLYHNIEPDDYPPHWHSNMEIIMPLKGWYGVEMNDRRYDLKEGELVFISSCAIHHLYAPEEGERLIFQPDYSLISTMPELSSYMTLLSPALFITRDKDEDLMPRLQELMIAIEKEYMSKNPLAGESIYAMLLEMLVLIGRKYSANADSIDVSRGKQQEYAEKFASVCSYISSHYAEELTLEEIAGMSGFSKYHFARLFKQFTGKTFYRYVNLKRIENAELLLSEPGTSVTEIAVKSGFSSLPAFVRMFKLIKGCTPTEFKKMQT